MKASVSPWSECEAAYRETGLPLGDDVEVTASQLLEMTEKFDVQVRTVEVRVGKRDRPVPDKKVIYLSPLRRGFSQR